MISIVTGLRDGPAPGRGTPRVMTFRRCRRLPLLPLSCAAGHVPTLPTLPGTGSGGFWNFRLWRTGCPAVTGSCGCSGPLIPWRCRPPWTLMPASGDRIPVMACRSAGSRPAMPSAGGRDGRPLEPDGRCPCKAMAQGPDHACQTGQVRAMTRISRRTAKRPAPHRVTQTQRQDACRGDADRTGLHSSGQVLGTHPQTQQTQPDRGQLCHPQPPQGRQQGMSRLRDRPGDHVPADDARAEEMAQARWPEPPAREQRGD